MNIDNRKTLIVGIGAALVIGGLVSHFASSAPDGLEKTQEDLGAAEPVHKEVAAPPSPFAEYSLACLGEGFLSNAAAGAVGSLLVLAILLGTGYVLKRRARPPVRTDGT